MPCLTAEVLRGNTRSQTDSGPQHDTTMVWRGRLDLESQASFLAVARALHHHPQDEHFQGDTGNYAGAIFGKSLCADMCSAHLGIWDTETCFFLCYHTLKCASPGFFGNLIRIFLKVLFGTASLFFWKVFTPMGMIDFSVSSEMCHCHGTALQHAFVHVCSRLVR